MSTPPIDDSGSIAIVGLAGRFPAARSAGELWTLLRDGKEATQWLTPDELRAAGVDDADIEDPDYVRASLVLPDMEMFDPEFFGFSKRDAASARSAAPPFSGVCLGGAGRRGPYARGISPAPSACSAAAACRRTCPTTC